MAEKKNVTEEVENTKKNVTEEKMKTVFIPRTSPKEEDVRVWVNMKCYTIKRGEEVEVPESVYEVIKNSERMKMKAMEYASGYQV